MLFVFDFRYLHLIPVIHLHVVKYNLFCFTINVITFPFHKPEKHFMNNSSKSGLEMGKIRYL